MTWTSAWGGWKWTAGALGACLGAVVIDVAAWRSGYAANAFGLLGCHFLRFLLLLVAGLMLIQVFRAAARREKPPAATGPTVLDVAALVLCFSGCLGCYPVWPVILLLLACPLLVELLFFRKGNRPAEDKWVLLRVGLVVGLFTLTWYLCAATTREALRGLGARIEARVGADRLRAWAGEVIAAHPPGQGRGALEPDEIPDFVVDLLGPFQGVRGAEVRPGDDPSVDLFTGGSAYHFRIRVRPSRVSRDLPPWWVGEGAGLESQPGIYLETEGK
jgi:hypothetical protein